MPKVVSRLDFRCSEALVYGVSFVEGYSHKVQTKVGVCFRAEGIDVVQHTLQTIKPCNHILFIVYSYLISVFGFLNSEHGLNVFST